MRKLPVFTERSLGDLQANRSEMAARHEVKIRDATVMCTAGCASCCYHPVRISILEGVLLFKHLVEHGRWSPSFKTKLAEHAVTTGNLAMGIWLMSNIACPLLDGKNRCIGYEARPFNCRSTFSVGDPHYCHPHRIGEGTGIVSRVGALTEFHEKEEAILKRHGLWHLLMPISQALLLAEKILAGDVDLESADHEFLIEYKGGA